MWRFLTSVHRAFRHHVQKPRPTAGAVVEEEKSDSDNDEQPSSAHLCPYIAFRQHVQKPHNPVHVCNKREHNSDSVAVLSNGTTNSDNGSILAYFGCVKGRSQDAAIGESRTSSGQDDDRNWWRQCHQDFWSLVQGSSCRVAEAVSLGSFFFCGGDSDRQRCRARLLYRVLFALPEKRKAALGMTSHTVTSNVNEESELNTTTGKAVDEKVDQSKTEEQNLDSVFAEFNLLCQDYTAVRESLQGLEAWERGDIKSGVEHLSEAADLGHASACFNMALCYETGTGVTVDTNKAQKYYKMAAEKGHSMAMYNLGLLYFNQSDVNQCVTKNTEVNFEKEGLQMMERAAKHGLAEAQTYMGFHHMYQTENLAQALNFFTSAAQQKHGEAQYLLALCHEQGWGVEVNECRAALFFSQAAAGGHDLATCCLAEYNEKGMGGLPEDKASAKNLYTKAADMGNQVARTRLNELLAQEKLDFWKNKVSSFQEKLSTFQKLYQVHHRQELKGNSPPQPLSPSSSSPNLTNHKGPDYFLSDEIENRKTKKDLKLKVSFDRDKKLGIHFTLGESLDMLNDDDEIETDYSNDTSHDSCHSGSGDEAVFSLGSFHKSNTVPNLAIV